jgi:hypothetical protein
MLLEQYLPTFDVRDYHEVRVVAPADTACAVLCSLDLHRSWIVQALFTICSLPSRLRGSTSPPPLQPTQTTDGGPSRRSPGTAEWIR